VTARPLPGAIAAGAPEAARVLEPIVTEPREALLVIAAAYLVTLATSGLVVRLVAGNPQAAATDDAAGARRRRQGLIIGKCENVIAVTFILAGQETGLALIFAAKSIVRRDDIKRDPDYYLGGTLVNLVWSLILAFSARVLVAGL